MKSITTYFTVLLLIVSTNSFSQKNTIKANGNITTENRTVANFDKIAISGSFKVTLIKGKEGPITIEASDNLMEAIETEVKDGLLSVKFKSGWNIRNSKRINITITFENITGIAMSGSGSVTSTDEVIANDLAIKISGSGSLNLKVFTDKLETAVSGSGNVKLKGETNILTCSISGSGNVNAADLKASITNAKVSGSGNVKVNALKEIHAKTSGSGHVYYSGNPTIIKVNSSGSGSIRKI